MASLSVGSVEVGPADASLAIGVVEVAVVTGPSLSIGLVEVAAVAVEIPDTGAWLWVDGAPRKAELWIDVPIFTGTYGGGAYGAGIYGG